MGDESYGWLRYEMMLNREVRESWVALTRRSEWRMRQWLRWLPFLVIFSQVVLYATGVLTLKQAAVFFFVLEGLLAVVIVGEFVLLLRNYRRAQRAGASRGVAFTAALDAVLPQPVAYLARQEFRLFSAIFGAMRRRRVVEPGARVFSYSGHLRPLLVVMVLVSLVELAVVEFFIPWNWLRWTLLLLGVYGLLWVTGFVCSLYTRPHAIGERELRLRFGIFTDVPVPLSSVASATQSLRSSHNKLVEIDGGLLSLSVLGSTNVSVRIDPPVAVDLGRRGRHYVDQVRFYSDDPARAVELLQDGPAERVVERRPVN